MVWILKIAEMIRFKTKSLLKSLFEKFPAFRAGALVDFLVTKGFPKDDLKPTSKLTEDMYRALQQEFSSDKAAKAKSDAIEIPKGTGVEAKKKKDWDRRSL